MIDLEYRMTIKTLAARGLPNRQIARQLGVSEGSVRYHRKRMAEGAVDGRSLQTSFAESFGEAIDHWMSSHARGTNLAALHHWLVSEHDYAGSLRSVQRYVKSAYPLPAKRARRRVETPPGAQAQADWATFPNMIVAGQSVTLQAFHLLLSHSRGEAIVWQFRQDQLSWLDAHNQAFTRLGGIPAVVRVDNTKTAVSHGAGSWGELNPTYRRYALTLRFHVDPCQPYSPEHKGKVERAVRTQRFSADPTRQAWENLLELQAWTDAEVARLAQRRRCPATGDSVWASWQAERAALAPLPILPVPFDAIATRRVSADALVHFEARQYSVPFTCIGQTVEVRGGAGRVQIFRGADLVADHPRGTAQRIVLESAHYDGPGTREIQPPTPLGKLGQRLQALADLPVEHRPIDLYAALAEAVA